MSYWVKTFLLVLFMALVLAACNHDGKDTKIPDVSSVQLPPVHVKRFDLDLFPIDTNDIKTGMERLSQSYPSFMPTYLMLLQPDPSKPVPPEQLLRSFLSDKFVRELADTCALVFKNMEGLEKDFDQAFRFYKYYFPEKPTPDLVACVTVLNYGAFIVNDSLLGIGLDFFLGADYPPYNGIFPKYVARTMNKDHLAPYVVRALADDIVGPGQGERLIDKMINNGKKLYILDRLLPMSPDSVKLGYTPEQVAWCAQNELQMWAFFLEEDLLYSTKLRDYQPYVTPGPRSPRMPAEAPGETGNWMGLQIVKKYMERNPSTSLQQLVDIQDSQIILDGARYKPKQDSGK
jgi:hypothetical protein